MWSKVLSFFGGSSKAVDNILDKDKGLLSQVGGYIGNLNFTTEEQAEHNKKMADAVSDFAVKTLDENTERSKARRDIAKMWIKTQLALILLIVIVAPLDMQLAEFYGEIAFGGLMMGGTWSVIAFHFGGHYLRTLKR